MSGIKTDGNEITEYFGVDFAYNYTSGPWRLLDTKKEHPFDGIYRISGKDNPLPKGVTKQFDNRPIIAECNKLEDARVISLVPEMLEALQLAADGYFVAQKAKKILKKIEGK